MFKTKTCRAKQLRGQEAGHVGAPAGLELHGAPLPFRVRAGRGWVGHPQRGKGQSHYQGWAFALGFHQKGVGTRSTWQIGIFKQSICLDLGSVPICRTLIPTRDTSLLVYFDSLTWIAYEPPGRPCSSGLTTRCFASPICGRNFPGQHAVGVAAHKVHQDFYLLFQSYAELFFRAQICLSATWPLEDAPFLAK
jgi:hypothetical protein